MPVEHRHRLALVGNRLLDRVRGAPRVGAHRILLALVAVEPALPLRIEVLGRLHLHPGGEAFVEPQVVPPAHGDEIAEPLVRDLVGDDAENAAAGGIRVRGRIEQQTALEERDRAPVLHSAAEAARDGDQVELGQRILDAEIVVEVVQQIDRGVEREAALRALAGGGDDADGDAVGLRRQPLELARRQHEQVARHFRRGGERDLLQVRRHRLLLRDRHVGDGEVAAPQRDGERERRLEGGLVPAREHAAGIGGLEMARDHPLLALLGRVVDVEQPAAEPVDRTREADAQLVRADRERLRKRQGRGLGGGVERDGGAQRLVGGGAGERHVDGVEHHSRGWLAHLDIGHNGARERELLQIGLELDRVVGRDDGLRQLAGRGGE